MRFISITEAAKRLGTDTAGVQFLVNRGKLRRYRRWYGASCFVLLDVLQLQRAPLFPRVNDTPSNLDYTYLVEELTDLDFTK